jgi:hypothetical protein
MSLESSSVVLRDRKRAGVSVSEVDTGAQLVAGLTSTLEPDEALRIRYALKMNISIVQKSFVSGGKSIDISCLSCVVSRLLYSVAKPAASDDSYSVLYGLVGCVYH